MSRDLSTTNLANLRTGLRLWGPAILDAVQVQTDPTGVALGSPGNHHRSNTRSFTLVWRALGSETNGVDPPRGSGAVNSPSWTKKYAKAAIKPPSRRTPSVTSLTRSPRRRAGEEGSARGRTKNPGYSEVCAVGLTTSRVRRLRRCLCGGFTNSAVRGSRRGGMPRR